jgi:c-di-GMP-binding flagellar brake protein YcgR
MGTSNWTSLAEWIAAFRRLHVDAREGGLDAAALSAYEQEREALAQALLTAQRLSVRLGQTARQALRVALALPVELALGEPVSTTTIDLAVGGFAVLLAKPLRVSQSVDFALHLEAQAEVLRGRARVVSLQRKGKPFRVALAFEALSAAQTRWVSLEVFEAALERVPR